MHERGQVGIENLILFGALLIFLTAILYVSMELIVYNYRISQLQDAVDAIILSANQISRLGRGSVESVNVYLPKGIQSVSITGNVLAVDYTAKGEIATISGTAEADLMGDMPRENGKFSIDVTFLGDNLVKIGESPYLWRLEPNMVRFTELPVTVKIHGVDFTPEAVIKIDGEPYPEQFTYYRSPSLIEFDAIPGHLPPLPHGGSYFITVLIGEDESNALEFTITRERTE